TSTTRTFFKQGDSVEAESYRRRSDTPTTACVGAGRTEDLGSLGRTRFTSDLSSRFPGRDTCSDDGCRSSSRLIAGPDTFGEIGASFAAAAAGAGGTTPGEGRDDGNKTTVGSTNGSNGGIAIFDGTSEQVGGQCRRGGTGSGGRMYMVSASHAEETTACIGESGVEARMQGCAGTAG
ncbi:unnamed protein product, partial [Sphacelaria rigidula]